MKITFSTPEDHLASHRGWLKDQFGDETARVWLYRTVPRTTLVTIAKTKHDTRWVVRHWTGGNKDWPEWYGVPVAGQFEDLEEARAFAEVLLRLEAA